MANYNINAVTRRVVYTGSAGTGPYSFTFEVLVQTDLAVYFNATKLTLTTDYTVTINANGTGSITIVTGTNVPSTPTGSDTITIIGARDIERTTDFVTAGELRAAALNEQLDALTIFDQQIAEENKRQLIAPEYDPAHVDDGGTLDMTLPAKASRLGKVLAFDATTGNPIAGDEIGEYKGDWAASTAYEKRDLVKDTSTNNIFRANTAHTSSGAQPLTTNTDAAKWDLIVDAASANASATAAASSATAAASSASAAATSESNASSSASSASTSAGTATTKASEASTSAASAAASYDDFDDRYLGAKSAEPSVDNDGDALATGAIFFDTTAGAMKVWNGSAWEAAYVAGSGFAATANNLSDLASASSARTNLGLGTAATTASTDYAAVANNLSDLSSASSARTNLGLGDAATKTVGTSDGNVIAADATGLPVINGSQVTALNGSNISSGTVAVARLGSGSPSAANFLSGDGTWKEPGGGDELVEEVEITSSSTYATIQPTTGWFDNTYKHLYLWGFGFRPNSNNVDLRVEFGYEDSGQQWNTTANEYFTVAENTRISGGTTGMYTTTSTNVIHHAANDFDAQGDFVQGPIFIDLSWFAQTSVFGLSKVSSRRHPICRIHFGYGEFTSNTNMTNLTGVFGCHEGLNDISGTATAWSGIRFAFSSGSIIGAHLFLFGRK